MVEMIAEQISERNKCGLRKYVGKEHSGKRRYVERLQSRNKEVCLRKHEESV